MPDDHKVAVLSNTGLAIGLHGSILVLAMFLPPGSLLAELYPFAVPSKSYTPYKTMAQLPGLDLNYLSWENRHEANTVVHINNPPHLGGIAHLPQAEQLKVRGLGLLCTDRCIDHELQDSASAHLL